MITYKKYQKQLEKGDLWAKLILEFLTTISIKNKGQRSFEDIFNEHIKFAAL